MQLKFVAFPIYFSDDISGPIFQLSAASPRVAALFNNGKYILMLRYRLLTQLAFESLSGACWRPF